MAVPEVLKGSSSGGCAAACFRQTSGDNRPALLLKVCCLACTHTAGSPGGLREMQGPLLA